MELPGDTKELLKKLKEKISQIKKRTDDTTLLLSEKLSPKGSSTVREEENKQIENLTKENKYLEEKAENEKRKLELKINSLSNKLAVQDRVASKKTLDEIERFVWEFNRYMRDTRGMIHEIVDMSLKSPDMPDELKDKIKIIDQKFDQIMNIRNQMGTKYHINAPNIKKVNINQLIETNLGKISPKIESQKIDIHHRNSEKQIIVSVDPELLGEAINNIITNSIESMPDGGSINIQSELINNEFILEIADTGTGIPSHLIDKVFNPFFTTNPEKHAGLGLTQTYWISRLHNGNIKIESTAKEGTKVKIILPLITD